MSVGVYASECGHPRQQASIEDGARACASGRYPVLVWRTFTGGSVGGAGWTEVVALAAAFAIAVMTTPAGVSGAVLLLPFQVRVLARLAHR